MKGDNLIADKSYAFSLRIIKLYRYLTKSYDYTIGKQIFRSGTSIGANVKEGVYAQSDADFISKLSIALKEASETEYWLRLLRDSEYITNEQANSILTDCEELIKLLTAIIKTKKQNMQKA